MPSFLVAFAWSTMLLSDPSVSIMVDIVGMLSLSIIGEITLMLVMVRGMDMLSVSVGVLQGH